ncbi:unnamed protein product [Clonostachys rosea f. rosea IK726]|uniref:Uncharacterized protein n=1 Tax=Clonostachys rosea f. rosea IK726 TaxID=1349383 RepID=A0ACA9UM97_BIOOC|nr:unnamed protein product [Clonostachys rosea f. rosea IK726]
MSSSFEPDSMEPIILLCTFLTVLVYHTRKSVPLYAAKFRKASKIPLYIHMVAGAAEIIRYHITALADQPSPDLLDLALCLLQSATTLHLAKTLIRGDQTTRPTYQVSGLIRPFLTLAALYADDEQLHRGSVKLVNGFIYVRLIIFSYRVLKLDRVFTGPAVYAHAIFIGGLLAVYEAGFPFGVPAYVIQVGLVTSLHRFVADYVQRRTTTGHRPQRIELGIHVRLLLFAGLADLQTIKWHQKPPELMSRINDLYGTNQET